MVARGAAAQAVRMTESLRFTPYLAGLAELSDRERTVLELLADGETNDGIARRLFLSIKTVETHIAHIYLKLGLLPDRDVHRRVTAAIVFELHRARPLALVG